MSFGINSVLADKTYMGIFTTKLHATILSHIEKKDASGKLFTLQGTKKTLRK